MTQPSIRFIYYVTFFTLISMCHLIAQKGWRILRLSFCHNWEEAFASVLTKHPWRSSMALVMLGQQKIHLYQLTHTHTRSPFLTWRCVMTQPAAGGSDRGGVLWLIVVVKWREHPVHLLDECCCSPSYTHFAIPLSLSHSSLKVSCGAHETCSLLDEMMIQKRHLWPQKVDLLWKEPGYQHSGLLQHDSAKLEKIDKKEKLI